MLMRSTRIRASLLGLAGVILALTACGGGGSGDTVRFGVAAPLEQFIGSHALRGAELARDQLNAAGGVDGRTVELVAMTDSASTRLAVTVADDLYTDASVLAVVGHVNSGAMLAAAPIYNRGQRSAMPASGSSASARAMRSTPQGWPSSRCASWVRERRSSTRTTLTAAVCEMGSAGLTQPAPS
jgi:ABC-type branched-subunit amino acid transport system substrate-binding protein